MRQVRTKYYGAKNILTSFSSFFSSFFSSSFLSFFIVFKIKKGSLLREMAEGEGRRDVYVFMCHSYVKIQK
jgi:hypothetical protein